MPWRRKAIFINKPYHLLKMNTETLLQREIALLKTNQAESVRLLKASKTQCGMVLGEEIEAHIAQLTGARFSATDYHYERPTGEQ